MDELAQHWEAVFGILGILYGIWRGWSADRRTSKADLLQYILASGEFATTVAKIAGELWRAEKLALIEDQVFVPTSLYQSEMRSLGREIGDVKDLLRSVVVRIDELTSQLAQRPGGGGK